MSGECQYIYRGPDQNRKVCTLSGHACLCVDEWQHCTRRQYAQEYEAKHPKTPKQWNGVILTDSTGHLTDVI